MKAKGLIIQYTKNSQKLARKIPKMKMADDINRKFATAHLNY